MFFSFNGVMKSHRSPEQAIARAEEGIRVRCTSDGYDDGIEDVCWGVVVQRAETADPNADYRTHHYTLQDTGGQLPETQEDREQALREKRYQDRLEAIADSVGETIGAEDPWEILTLIERGIERLKENQKEPK